MPKRTVETVAVRHVCTTRGIRTAGKFLLQSALKQFEIHEPPAKTGRYGTAEQTRKCLGCQQLCQSGLAVVKGG